MENPRKLVHNLIMIIAEADAGCETGGWRQFWTIPNIDGKNPVIPVVWDI
jgi:hypothetical protein